METLKSNMKQKILLSALAIMASAMLQAQNVGIGTVTPDRPLTIKTAGNAGDLLSLRDTLDITRWHLNLYNGGLNIVQTGINSSLFLATDGNVGVGATAPQHRLDVLSNADLTTIARFRKSGGGIARIVISNSFSDGEAELGVDGQGAYAGSKGGNFRLRSNASDRIIIMSSGDVGIGSSAPAYRLDVTSPSINSTVASFSNAGGYAQIQVGNGTDIAQMGIDNNGMFAGSLAGLDVRIRTDGIGRVTVKSATGYMGVGVNNPKVSLHVNGAIAAEPGDVNVSLPFETVTPGNRSYLKISNFTNTLSTITLANGITDGQMLTIIAATNGLELIQFLDNAANNTQLSSNFSMGADDTLQLIWDAARSAWIELHRSVN
jgi:hypothetical protein